MPRFRRIEGTPRARRVRTRLCDLLPRHLRRWSRRAFGLGALRARSARVLGEGDSRARRRPVTATSSPGDPRRVPSETAAETGVNHDHTEALDRTGPLPRASRVSSAPDEMVVLGQRRLGRGLPHLHGMPGAGRVPRLRARPSRSRRHLGGHDRRRPQAAAALALASQSRRAPRTRPRGITGRGSRASLARDQSRWSPGEGACCRDRPRSPARTVEGEARRACQAARVAVSRGSRWRPRRSWYRWTAPSLPNGRCPWPRRSPNASAAACCSCRLGTTDRRSRASTSTRSPRNGRGCSRIVPSTCSRRRRPTPPTRSSTPSRGATTVWSA